MISTAALPTSRR